VPFGHDLISPEKEAWPIRARESLVDILAPLPETMSVEVLNLAIPGVPSYVQAQTADDHVWTQLASCHVIIVDITVNDCPESDLLQDSLGTAYTSFVAEGGHMMKALLRLIFTDRNSTLPIGLKTRALSMVRPPPSPSFLPEEDWAGHRSSHQLLHWCILVMPVPLMWPTSYTGLLWWHTRSLCSHGLPWCAMRMWP